MTLRTQACERGLVTYEAPDYFLWVFCGSFKEYERYRQERPGLRVRYLGRAEYIRERGLIHTRIGSWERRWNRDAIKDRLRACGALEVEFPRADYGPRGEFLSPKVIDRWEY